MGEAEGRGARVRGGALEREVSLPLLVLYGLGTTVGAGIYALTGEVTRSAGTRAPLSFLVAAALAAGTALGFAELAGRLPKAAGEAVFVDHAFHSRFVTLSVGAAVGFAGVVACAAILNAFGGYLAELVEAPRWWFVVGLVVALTMVAMSGVKESVGMAAVFTVIEISGLLLVVWAGRGSLGEVPGQLGHLVGPPTGVDGWGGVLGGAFLAFFAFLGFEDIDSVAEETRAASVNLPRAILLTLAVTAVLYVTVSTVAVLEVDSVVLGSSDAPLSLVYERTGGNPDLMSVIAALAMVNGALIQLVMIPRVVYGLSNLGLVPSWAGAVSRRTHTPVRATVLGAVVVALLALSLDLGPLARLTSAATMAIFVTVNVALIVIKRRDGPTSTFQVPMWAPVAGIVASTAMFVAEAAVLFG